MLLAYHQIGQNPGEGAASPDQIDSIVDNFYATPPSTTSKRKNACPRFMVQPSNQEARETFVSLYERRGSKCRIVSIPDTAVVQID